jgi:hypothetical protein
VCNERRVGCWCVVDRGFQLLRLFWRSTCFKLARTSASRNSKAGKAPKKLTASDNAQSNMPAAIRNTVDRLDKPSAYYQSRVSNSNLWRPHKKSAGLTITFSFRTRNANTTEMATREERTRLRSQRRTR